MFCEKELITLLNSHTKNENMSIAMEECAELIQAISKVNRYGKTEETMSNLLEEMADVNIIIDILLLYFNISPIKLTEEYERKMKRNMERIKCKGEGVESCKLCTERGY